jgi:glutathione synthase
LDIYKQVVTEGMAQTKVLGIHRSDYMIHTRARSGVPTLKQVEMNRISAAFGSLSTLTGELHHYLVDQCEEWSTRYPLNALPISTSRTLLPAHLARAHQLYGRPKFAFSFFLYFMPFSCGIIPHSLLSSQTSVRSF